MSNLNERFEKILGAPLTDKQKQEIFEIGSALKIADNDALWTMLVMHYSFEGRYERILERIEATGQSQRESLQSAGKVAATQAQADINQAVKSLVPTVSVEVAKAAKLAVRRIGISQSMFSLWVGGLIVSLIFILGIAFGSRLYIVAVNDLKNYVTSGITWRKMTTYA